MGDSVIPAVPTLDLPRKEEGGTPSSSGNVDSCLRARKDSIPQSMYGNLTLPFINLGLPKMGTSSIHAFFGCAGYEAKHHKCLKAELCAKCILQSISQRLPPLTQCGIADVYSQIDGNIAHALYLPQTELLEEFVHGYPNATFLLTFRSMEKWYHSISNWPPTIPTKLKDLFFLSPVTGLPSGKGRTLQVFSDFFCNHVQRVRAIVPPHRLVEIDIDDPTISTQMADIFDVEEECWGLANVNANLDPEMKHNKTVAFPWYHVGKLMIRGKNGVMRRNGNFRLPLGNASDMMDSSDIGGGSNGHQIKGNDTGDGMHTAMPDNCQQLIAHENGHWHHITHADSAIFPVLNDSAHIYFPQEMSWLKSQTISRDFGTCQYSNRNLMYNTLLGHQGGCGVKAFKPTHSAWVNKKTNSVPETDPSRKPDYFTSSPTLRLVRRLANANATLCFSGDSIDYQIYVALASNLERIDQLHTLHNPGKHKLVSVMMREIPVTHSTNPGNRDDWFLRGRRPPDTDVSFVDAHQPPPGGFGHYAMRSILETKAYFHDEQGSKTKEARIRYYMSYGWSPWNVDFMEDCNVIVMNFALHYTPDGEHLGMETKHQLRDDMLAAITYLTNFTSSNDNRVAVWRSALPQHFATTDGHFYGWKKLKKEHTCSPIGKNNKTQQVYNKVYDEAFSEMCQLEQQIDSTANQSCDQSRHRCKVNPVAEVDYQTTFKFWNDNNCTKRIEREQLRLSNFSGGIGEHGDHVTGTIHRWNIFNLFDVEWWHSKDMDCSHVCYVPSLFEAAFERLELLLSPVVTPLIDTT
eukprot:CAMPEP_0181078204 /NCGR_PEP_ID=MMETSP1071-20121207/1361_1 /TAXON_ID=35127 /ORGANISM="Thalassiosira sp., Strain NH16" /LENGTH=801 /DNA_ID=CAMNT_0023159503 /DNA_START=172 /DNA_END=2577 /DNA_ORIENTATION=-